MSSNLTELQMALLQVLWKRGQATVNEVHEAVGAPRGLAPATVATLLRRLEKKGIVSHEQVGRQFIYRAVTTAENAGASVVEEVAQRLQRDQVPTLINYLLESNRIGSDELAEVKRLIEARERADDLARADRAESGEA